MNLDTGKSRRLLQLASASALALSLAACDQNTSAEKIGRDVGRAADKAGQQIGQAAATAERKIDQTAAAAGEKLAEAGNAMDDAALTAKVKSALIAEPGLKALAIDVDTSGGVITLNGTVNNDENRNKAVQLAQGVQGVKSVRDNLVVSRGS